MYKLLFYIMIISFFQSLTACGQQTYEQKLESLYGDSSVPLIDPKQMQEKLLKEEVILLDTRSFREFKVSHLPSAKYVGYDNFNISVVSEIPKSYELIVYCSVGYRSNKIGEKLMNAGFEKVQNLYGGIFQWKNEGFDVVNSQGERTDSVHAFNKRWGKWLQEGKAIKVYE